MQSVSPAPDTLELAQRIAAHFTPLPQVAAIAIAGSQMAGTSNPSSDLDIYIYTRGDVPLEMRQALADARATGRADVGMDEWGAGDMWTDRDSGRDLDLIYFETLWMEQGLDRLLVHHQPSLGYTTAFWSTLQRSFRLFDRDGWFAMMQSRAAMPYPEPLRRAIIAKNFYILRDKIPSYFHQLEASVRRRDRVMVNHQVTGLLASYFDVLFALNRVPHPGEKRQIRYVQTLCPARPADMEAQLEGVLNAVAAPWDNTPLLETVTLLIDDLESLLRGVNVLVE